MILFTSEDRHLGHADRTDAEKKIVNGATEPVKQKQNEAWQRVHLSAESKMMQTPHLNGSRKKI